MNGRKLSILLWLLLAVGIIRLWLMPLPSSFWVDEMATAFVVHFGGHHPSFAIAPQVPASIYYVLPQLSEALLGFSEISYRLPSMLALAVGLFFIARLSARLIHPDASWFTVFACLGLKLFNYQAGDARPYALGTCVAAVSVWALVRWLDKGRWQEALLFIATAALLWRVHLIFWPFYLVYATYALVRLWKKETTVQWTHVLAAFVLLGAMLIPTALQALALNRQAGSHSFAPMPTVKELLRTLKMLGLITACFAAAALLHRFLRWQRGAPVMWSTAALILAWWLWHPLCLFAYSWLTGNSVWVPRYLSIALPGVALMATLVVALFLPPARWKSVSAVFGTGVLIVMAQWGTLWPLHHNSDWRTASRRLNELSLGPATPILVPSTFIESQPPVWRPDYPLPGFLYCNLLIYPPEGKPYLFPYEMSAEARQYAHELLRTTLPSAGRFFVYGGDYNSKLWREFFSHQPELTGWTSRSLGPFGDVNVVMFEKPGTAFTLTPGTPPLHTDR